MTRVLLLGGTAEARVLARQLALDVDLTLSLAGRTKRPELDGVRARIGGFGGEDGFATYLRETKTSAVLDATHPFAPNISLRSARIAAQLGVPYRLLLRPGWKAEPGDDWIRVPTIAAAAEVPDASQRVFLATGRQTLDAFATMQAAYCWARQVDPPDRPFPMENGSYVVARPPFSVDAEIELFRDLGVTMLMSKDAGGLSGRAKLVAARRLGLPVVMIDRPDYDGVPQVTDAAEARAWVKGLR